MSAHLSTLKLHQLRYGELSGEALATARAHLDSCNRCSGRLAAQENHRAAFELAPVPQGIRDLEAPRPSAPRWLQWVAGPLLAAAAVLMAVPSADLGDPAIPSLTEEVRPKGVDRHLEVWVEERTGPRPVGDGEVVHPGNRLQLRYRRPTAPWVTLAGTDATGTVEVYGTWRTDVGTSAWQTAPFALVLDDTVGPQRFHAVFSPERPDPADVSSMIEAGAVPRPNQMETIEVQNR